MHAAIFLDKVSRGCESIHDVYSEMELGRVRNSWLAGRIWRITVIHLLCTMLKILPSLLCLPSGEGSPEASPLAGSRAPATSTAPHLVPPCHLFFGPLHGEGREMQDLKQAVPQGQLLQQCF